MPRSPLFCAPSLQTNVLIFFHVVFVCPCSHPIQRASNLQAPSAGIFWFRHIQQGQEEWQSPLQLRGGAAHLRSSRMVNFLTGEPVDEVALVDVDSDDDMTGARPVDWLPRGNFLLPEERNKLCYDYDEQAERRSPLSRGGKRSKKASGFLRWHAKMAARVAAARARIEEAAAQVVLDMASKYSCGLGEHWARRVLAGRSSRRRREAREALKFPKSDRKGCKILDSPSACLPLDSRTSLAARTFGAGVVRRLASLRKVCACMCLFY